MARKATTKKSARSADDHDKAVGALIRERRLALGLSQSDLGKRIGVTFQQIQKYERGRNRLGASRLERTAEALDVPVSYLFSLIEGRPSADKVSSILEGPTDPALLRMVKAFDRIESWRRRQALVLLAEDLARG